MRLGPVHLTVRDMARSVAFYRGLLGVDESLVVLHEDPHATAPRGHAGLFHTAFLYAGRPELGAVLRRLGEHGWPLDGASDHLVSEALYLNDPDGLGVELYRDRPRAQWPSVDGHLQMDTRPLDLRSLAADAAPETGPPQGVGHVHLQALDLEQSRVFYEGLGMDAMTTLPGALFMAWDGYHHHLGLNRWARATQPASPDSVGLRGFTLVGEGEERTLTDPSGIRVFVTSPATDRRS